MFNHISNEDLKEKTYKTKYGTSMFGYDDKE